VRIFTRDKKLREIFYEAIKKKEKPLASRTSHAHRRILKKLGAAPTTHLMLAPFSVNEILNQLVSEDRETQQLAIEEIGKIGGFKEIFVNIFARFAELLEQEIPAARFNSPLFKAITETIIKLGGTSARIFIYQVLESWLSNPSYENEGRCRCALQVIGRLGINDAPSAILESITSLLIHEYPVFRFYAAEATANLGTIAINGTVQLHLIKLIADKEWWSERDTDDIEDGEGEYYVAEAAARALGRLNNNLNLPAEPLIQSLISLLELGSENKSLRNAAVEAIDKLILDADEKTCEKAIKQLSLLQTNPNKNVKKAAQEVINKFSTKKAAVQCPPFVISDKKMNRVN
jgi:hypothetical protein